MNFDLMHVLIDVLTPVVLSIVAYVTIMTRVERGQSDLKIQKSQADLKDDFNKKHSENKQDLAVHIAQDTGQFNAIQSTLIRIDSKLDKIANGKP